VNEIEVDDDGNIQINRVYTKAEFEAALDDIPIGEVSTLTDVFPDNAVLARDTPDWQNKLPQITVASGVGTGTVGIYEVTLTGYLTVHVGSSVANQSVFVKVTLPPDTTISGAVCDYAGSTGINGYWKNTIPVIKGQRVLISYVGSGNCTYYVIPIPPDFTIAPNPNLQVEIGGDYSTDEQPVMVMDAVTKEIRQQLDLDGRPIWIQTFAGTITAASGADVNTVIKSGVKNMIGNPEGWWMYTGDAKAGWGGSNNSNLCSNVNVSASGDLAIYSKYSSAARTNAPYQVTFKYTKI
jgi:hypothetical protein